MPSPKPPCSHCRKPKDCISVRAGGKQYPLCEACYGRYLDLKDKVVGEMTREFVGEGSKA